MYFLQTYLLAICSYPILCKTVEVQLFFRPGTKNDNVEEAIKKLPVQNTETLLQFYKDNINISNYNLPEGTITKYGNEINNF